MNDLYRLKKAYQRKVLPRIYALGSRVVCPYCGWHGWKFLPAGAKNAPNRLCPRCGSLERYRMLLLYLQQEHVFERPLRILDMAPKECFRNYVQRFRNLVYISSDLNAPSAMVFSDLTQMGMADNSFDLIVSPHILEHIPNDQAAFSELYRILSPNGFGMLMVPIRGSQTFEIPGALPQDYERLYGQGDHVRWYGLDIVSRMQNAGLEVQTLDMFDLLGSQICHHNGLYGDDRYYFRFGK